ncbi:immunoglobulin-like domain-containing protein [Paenibacillus filicis]|uniref:Immunoglobulin-like domain-containing protein n=1 Tax=Paenibacillus filicis TaxID=669464 RepID=A0ABU9DGV3_9BACL
MVGVIARPGLRVRAREGENWVKTGTGRMEAIVSIGYVLSPGGQWEQSITFSELASGSYRVGKKIEGVGTPIRKMVYAEFRIE